MFPSESTGENALKTEQGGRYFLATSMPSGISHTIYLQWLKNQDSTKKNPKAGTDVAHKFHTI